MTGFLILTAALLAACALTLLYPVFGRADLGKSDDAEMAVYRDQLDEVARDLARGVIDEDAAGAARVEIERRLLRTARRYRKGLGDRPLASHHSGRAATLVLALVILPVSTTALYVALGNPGKRDLPFAARDQSAPDSPPEIEAMVAGLEARLADDPSDIEGWKRLARSKQVVGRMDESVEAMRRALAQSPDDVDLNASLGESLVQLARGMVTPEARDVFEKVRRLAPLEPRAGYYLSLAEAQAGNFVAAQEGWFRLMAGTPKSAPWRALLETAINDVGRRLELDMRAIIAASPDLVEADGDGAPAPPSAAPTSAIDAETMARFDAMSEQDRMAQIVGMVERLRARLEREGGSAAEWRRLGRSMAAMNDPQAAQAAYAKALELAPDNIEIRRDYAISLIDETDAETHLPRIGDDAFAELEELVRRTPDDPEIHWYLGIRALQQRDKATAAVAWRRSLSLIGPDHPDRDTLQAMLDQLEAPGSSQRKD